MHSSRAECVVRVRSNGRANRPFPTSFMASHFSVLSPGRFAAVVRSGTLPPPPISLFTLRVGGPHNRIRARKRTQSTWHAPYRERESEGTKKRRTNSNAAAAAAAVVVVVEARRARLTSSSGFLSLTLCAVRVLLLPITALRVGLRLSPFRDSFRARLCCWAAVHVGAMAQNNYFGFTHGGTQYGYEIFYS